MLLRKGKACDRGRAEPRRHLSLPRLPKAVWRHFLHVRSVSGHRRHRDGRDGALWRSPLLSGVRLLGLRQARSRDRGQRGGSGFGQLGPSHLRDLGLPERALVTRLSSRSPIRTGSRIATGASHRGRALPGTVFDDERCGGVFVYEQPRRAPEHTTRHEAAPWLQTPNGASLSEDAVLVLKGEEDYFFSAASRSFTCSLTFSRMFFGTPE